MQELNWRVTRAPVFTPGGSDLEQLLTAISNQSDPSFSYVGGEHLRQSNMNAFCSSDVSAVGSSSALLAPFCEVSCRCKTIDTPATPYQLPFNETTFVMAMQTRLRNPTSLGRTPAPSVDH